MDNRFKYLPKASVGDGTHDGKSIADSEKDRGKYPCPCCGNITFPVPASEAVAYICHVCMWENDVFIKSDDEPSDENHGLTLSEARENFKKFSVCSERFAKKHTDE